VGRKDTVNKFDRMEENRGCKSNIEGEAILFYSTVGYAS